MVLGAKITFTATLPLSMTFSDLPIVLSILIILCHVRSLQHTPYVISVKSLPLVELRIRNP